MTVVLNLGCGKTRIPNSIGVDSAYVRGCTDIVHNLNNLPYPFASAYADEVHFYHVLEHLDDPISGNEKILQGIEGQVLEVGAGDGSRKKLLVEKYKRIINYVATDYNSWDEEFDRLNKKVAMSSNEILLGYKSRIDLDKVCSATHLPFNDNLFDYHISFEVLEHIDYPEKYFSEAARVVKKGGYVLVCSPFLMRMHGGEPEHRMDYCRYLNGFFYKVAEDNGMDVVEIYSNTGYGTTFASLTNQFLIRRMFESHLLVRVLLLITSPFIFLISNIVGYFIDVHPDQRFATRFHVKLKKR